MLAAAPPKTRGDAYVDHIVRFLQHERPVPSFLSINSGAVSHCTRQTRTTLSAIMLSGPPRLVPFIFVAFVLALVVWYYHGVSSTGASLSTWKPGSSFATQRPASLRPGVDPLDFSIPLRFSDGQPKPAGSNYTLKIVVPKTTKEDLAWMQEEIPHAPLVVYEVDNEKAENKVPKNKGREAMVRRRADADAGADKQTNTGC